MCLCIPTGKQIEDTFENPQWQKVKECNQWILLWRTIWQNTSNVHNAFLTVTGQRWQKKDKETTIVLKSPNIKIVFTKAAKIFYIINWTFGLVEMYPQSPKRKRNLGFLMWNLIKPYLRPLPSFYIILHSRLGKYWVLGICKAHALHQ